MHGHAARAVDGDYDQSLHSCTILDNFYVEKPVWMVDLGQKAAKVSGVMVVTWQGQGQGLYFCLVINIYLFVFWSPYYNESIPI